MFYTFEELSQLLELDSKNQTIDKICFDTSLELIQKYIGYIIEEKNQNELLTVKDNKILLNQISIKEVITITDQTTKEPIENFVIDYENKAILFLTCSYDKHVVFINYISGYTKETFPSTLKLAVINLFLHLQKNYLENKNNTDNKVPTEIPEDVKSLLKPYARKCL